MSDDELTEAACEVFAALDADEQLQSLAPDVRMFVRVAAWELLTEAEHD